MAFAKSRKIKIKSIFPPRFTARSKLFWIWFFSCNLWKFMIYDDVRDPLANRQRSGIKHRLGLGIGDCCFVNTQYESQYPVAWTSRINYKKHATALQKYKNELKFCEVVQKMWKILKNIWHEVHKKRFEKWIWCTYAMHLYMYVYVYKIKQRNIFAVVKIKIHEWRKLHIWESEFRRLYMSLFDNLLIRNTVNIYI